MTLTWRPRAVLAVPPKRDAPDVEFGLHVQDRRTARGMTQQELADAVGIGRSQIANIEAGRTATTAYRAALIARALGETVEDLFGMGATDAR